MQTRRFGQHGFTLIELAMVAVIVALLAAALLKRMLYYEEQAERTAVEQTLGVLRSAMHLQMADHVLHANLRPMSLLAGDNPMHWLAELPPNYAGEYASPKTGQIPDGNWYFDTSEHTLIYVPVYQDHLHTAAGENGKLRFRSRLTTGNSISFAEPGRDSKREASFEGVVLEPVQPYKWF